MPGGSCPTVGIAGLTLGGGVGVVSRAYGLTSDNVQSLQVVTADGQVRTCNSSTNADLFWACRGGGGGNFGVATSFTFTTHPAGEIILFFLSWPWSQAAPGATAFVHRNALFQAQYTTTWPVGSAPAAVSRQHAWQQSYWQSMRPYASGQAYQNYIDPALTNWRQAYYGANYTRLTQVKATYDPDRVFTFPQAV